MWSYLQKPVETGLLLQFYRNKALLSFQNVFELWQNNADFRAFYNQSLCLLPYTAIYWEHPPLLKTNTDAIYECMVLPAEALYKVAPEPHQFQQYYSDTDSAVSFLNLGKDARLIVPCPVENQSYPHLAAFIHNAPEEQIHRFWALVGETILNSLNDKPVWLSTAGLGVYWLHVRLDSRPKYYKTGNYKL